MPPARDAWAKIPGGHSLAITATCGECGSRERVLSLVTGSYCSSCLFAAVDKGYLTVIDSEDTPTCETWGCDNTPFVCEAHAIASCDNCGEGDASFCSVECAMAYTGDGPSECQNCGSDYGAAAVCSVSCAVSYFDESPEGTCEMCGISSTYDLYCSDCAEKCPECDARMRCTVCDYGAEYEASTTTPVFGPVLMAAEHVQSIDENTVTIDGITFDFD